MDFCERIKKICLGHNKVALFVDMDGTIAEYIVFRDGFITNETKEVFLNSKPIKIVIEKLQELSKLENLDIYILTLSKSRIIEEEKKEWLQRYTPFIKESNYIIITKETGDYSVETRDYIKYQKIEEKLRQYDYALLLDDDHKILRETQKKLKDNGEVFHVSSALI